MKLIVGLVPDIAEVDYFSLDTTHLDCMEKAIKTPNTWFVMARKTAKEELLKRAASVLCEYYHTTNIDLALDIYFDTDLRVELFVTDKGKLISIEEFQKALSENLVETGNLRNREDLHKFIWTYC